MLSIFQKQDIFTAALLNERLSNLTYKPYYDWKSGDGALPTREQSRQIMCTSSEELEAYYEKYPNAYDNLPEHHTDDVWGMYRGFGKDYKIVSFLEGINAEVTNFLV